MKNEISIIKGTTCVIPLTITDEDGAEYVLEENEKIIFGVKQNPENTKYDIEKILTADNYDGGSYVISVEPEDTVSLPFGRYWYDIGVQCVGGEYHMVIPCSEFWIERSVTSKEE